MRGKGFHARLCSERLFIFNYSVLPALSLWFDWLTTLSKVEGSKGALCSLSQKAIALELPTVFNYNYVPFEDREDERFLMTIFPSRKFTRIYLHREKEDE